MLAPSPIHHSDISLSSLHGISHPGIISILLSCYLPLSPASLFQSFIITAILFKQLSFGTSSINHILGHQGTCSGPSPPHHHHHHHNHYHDISKQSSTICPIPAGRFAVVRYHRYHLYNHHFWELYTNPLSYITALESTRSVSHRNTPPAPPSRLSCICTSNWTLSLPHVGHGDLAAALNSSPASLPFFYAFSFSLLPSFIFIICFVADFLLRAWYC